MASPLICIDARYIRHRPSGVGEVVRALVDHVPALAPDLHFMLLKHPDAAAPLSAAPNVTERVVRAAANGPATMWWLSRATDLSGVDLFHAPANIQPAGLAMPCVTTIHDLMWLKHPSWAARTRVTPSGVDPVFRPPSAKNRSPRGDRRYILTVGQAAPCKNHLGALEAFALAFGDRDDIDHLFVQRQGAGAAAGLARAAALSWAAFAQANDAVYREVLADRVR